MFAELKLYKIECEYCKYSLILLDSFEKIPRGWDSKAVKDNVYNYKLVNICPSCIKNEDIE